MLIVNKEEELVLHNGASERYTGVVFALFLIFRGISCTVREGIFITDEVLVVAVIISRTVEGVGTRLGDSVNGTTRKSTLPYVERCYIHLYLLYGLHGEGLCASLTSIRSCRGQTKHVVVHSAVYHERVVSVVCSGKRHSSSVGCSELGIEPGYVGNTMSNTWHVVDVVGVDALGGARLCGIQPALSCYNQLVKHFGILLHGATQVLRLAQQKVHIVEGLGLVSHIRHIHLVRSTYTHTRNGVSAIDVSHCAIDCS